MNNKSPIELNVAFQGGGAKLVSLIECAEYLQELESQGKIKINATSGTSAGSIVAVLLASGVDLKFVKVFFKSNQQLIAETLELKGKFKTLYAVYKGEPIFNHGSLRKLINLIFEAVEIQNHKFVDVQKPVTVVATNLNSQAKKIFSFKDSPQELILDAVEASCALPFAFKNYQTDNFLVDGGLCENLPIEEFDNNPEVYNLAVGFLRKESNIVNKMGFFEFVGRIVSSSINHNITRSEYSEKCDGIVKLNDSVDLLEFEKAIKLLDDPNHLRAIRVEVDDTLKRIETAKSRDLTLKQLEQKELSKFERQRIKLYEALSLLEHDEIDFVEKSLLVTPWCLYDDTRGNQADEVTQMERIIPRKPLKCLHLQLGLDIDDIERKDFLVCCDDIPINHKVFEVSANTSIGGKKEMFTSLFLFFEDELEAGKEYTIIANYGIKKAMEGLRIKRSDYLSTVHDRRKYAVYQYVAMVIYLPENLVNKTKLSHVVIKSEEDAGVRTMEGREIDARRLLKYQNSGLKKDLTSSPKGWSIENLQYMESCSVEIEIVD